MGDDKKTGRTIIWTIIVAFIGAFIGAGIGASISLVAGAIAGAIIGAFIGVITKVVIEATIGKERELALIHKDLDSLISVLADLVDILKKEGEGRDIEK